MSDSMIEKVARALAGSFAQPDEFWENWIPQARAAIEAMREPTEYMVIDGFEAMRGDWKMCRDKADDARRCWRAAIDRALKPAHAIDGALSTNENAAS